MSQIQVDTILDKEGTGAPQLQKGAEVLVGYGITGAGGVNISGFATAGGFVGNVTGNATGLSGTPDITVQNITAVGATFSGTLTYEDVTNVDATGIITAKSGIEFGTAGVGGTITGAGQAEFVGVVTASDFVGGGSQLTGLPAGFTELDAALFN
jgi:hypothetical protein